MSKPSYALLLALSTALVCANSVFAQQAPAPTASKPATAAKPGAQAPTASKQGTTATKRPATTPAPLKTNKEKGSYAIGMNIGNGLKKDGVDIDAASLTRGLKDALAGTKPALTDTEARAALTAMAAEVRAKQELKLETLAAPQ